MDKVMETVEQLTDLIGAIEKKLRSVDQKTEKMSLDVEKLNSRLKIAEADISGQKKTVLEKIDTIYNQITELKTLVYEAGLIVVGPDRIQQLEKSLEEKKKKAKARKDKPKSSKSKKKK